MKALRVTLRRFARRTLVVAGSVAVALLVVVCGLLVYLQTASGRRLLAAKVSAWVSRELVAELRIERIDVLARDRLAISGATLFDAKGRPVLRLVGLSAPLDLLTLLKNLFQPTARVELPNVHVERLEIGLYRAEVGGVSLTHAFDTRASLTPSKSPSSSEPAKGPQIHLPKVAIDCVSARTDLSGLSQATAELHALKLDFDFSPELLSLGVVSDDARVLQALPLAVKARVKAQVRLPGSTEATLEGSVGELPIQASFRAQGAELAFRVSSASLSPEAMRTLLPSWPLHVPSSVDAELSGHLPAMHARFEAQAGVSRLDATGTVALSPSIKGELALTGRELDARLLASEAGQTALGVDATLAFSLEPALHVELNARVQKGELFGAPLPATDIHAAYSGDKLSGTVASGEPALPVSADFSVSPQGAFGFHARAQNLDLAALSAYGLRAAGRADVDVNGELAHEQLAVQLEARIGDLLIAPLRAKTSLVRGKLQGPIHRLEQLGVEVEAQGTELSLGALEFPVWALESKGPLERQLVAVRAGPEAEPTLQASTTLALLHGVSLSETRLEAELNGVKHALELKSARVGAQLLDLRELHWQVGVGMLSGSALISGARKRVDLDVSGFEVEAVLKSLGVDATGFRGRLDASLQLEEDAHGRHGLLKGGLADGAVPAIGALHTQFAATLTNSELEGQGALAVMQLGQGTLSGRGTIGKEPISLQSLASALGELRLELSGVDLGEVSRRWLPTTSVALSGFADGSVRLAKPDARAPATVSYELRTRELGLHSARTDGDGVLRHAELSSRGEIAANETSLQIELKDAAGPWLSVRAEQRIGWYELEQVLRSSSPAALLDAPLSAEISARPRSLELLGVAVPRAFSGEVAANVKVTGTPRRPELEGSLRATGIGTHASDPSGELSLTFGYSAEREDYSFAAHYAERKLARLELSGAGHWGWFEHGFGKAWSVRAEGGIERIELAPIGDLLGVPISGEAGGHALISASASQLEASGELILGRLALERHSLGNGRLKLRVHQALAEAQLSLAGADSSLEASAELGLCWDGGPCIDAHRGGSLDAKVKNFQLASLAPLLRSVASEIRGPVNGFVSLAWDPADATGKRKTRLRADAVIKPGSVTLVGGTGSMQCVDLRASVKREDTLHLELSGCARSNETNLWANADLLFNGPLPQRVDAQLHTDAKRGVPVSSEGVVLGTAIISKNRPLQVNVDLTGARRTVQASIPALEFVLPAKDDTRLVDLTEDPTIHLTDAMAEPELSVETDAANPWSVSVKLGSAVSVKQAGMRVPVTGTLTQSPDGLLDGSIVLPEGGVVPQLGQIFRIKGGRVRFEHQAVNDGELNIDATTRTADGVVVDLHVSGTVEKPLVRLRSDPPRSENDIIALLLGVQGSDTTTSSGQKSSDLRGSATALAMNQLLRGSPLAGVQFGAGQTHKGDSVSTVSVRASNTVWLEGRTVRSSTQRAANTAVQSSGVIDWRFARGFSLRTQLGNISGLELRWSHRY